MNVYDYTTTNEIRNLFKTELSKRFELLGMLAYIGEKYLICENDKKQIESLIAVISDQTLFTTRFSHIMSQIDKLVYKSGKWDILGDMPYLIKHYINLYKSETDNDL